MLSSQDIAVPPRRERRGDNGSNVYPLTPISYNMLILYMNIIEFIDLAIVIMPFHSIGREERREENKGKRAIAIN